MDKFREWSRRSNTWQLLEIYTASSFPIYLCLRSSSRTVRETRRSHVNLPIYVGDSLFLPFLSLSISHIICFFLPYTSLSLAYVFLNSIGKENVDRASLYTYTGSSLLPFLFPRSYPSLSIDRSI